MISRYGTKRVMLSVILLCSLRYGFYSQMTTAWQTVAIEFFGGWCIGLFFAAMTTHASNIAPEGSGTKMVTLAFAAYMGVGEFL